MELNFKGDVAELVALVSNLQGMQTDEDLAEKIVEQFPQALINAIYHRDGN